MSPHPSISYSEGNLRVSVSCRSAGPVFLPHIYMKLANWFKGTSGRLDKLTQIPQHNYKVFKILFLSEIGLKISSQRIAYVRACRTVNAISVWQLSIF